MRLAPLVLAVASLGCGGPDPQEDVHGAFVIARLAVDPATELGDLFLGASDPEEQRLVDSMNAAFDQLACDAFQSLVIDVRASRTRQSGQGEVSLLIVTPREAGDLCGDERVAVVQSLSYREDDPEVPWVHGPAFIEGQTLDARIAIGDIAQAFGGTPIEGVGLFPRWFSLRARLSPFTSDDEGVLDASVPGERPGFTIRDVELSSVWFAGERLQQPAPSDPTGGDGTVLDQLVRRGLQPDVDFDLDGMERFRDEDGDGRVDLCLDGDGTRISGSDCPLRAEIADGYLVQLRFRVYPVTLE